MNDFVYIKQPEPKVLSLSFRYKEFVSGIHAIENGFKQSDGTLSGSGFQDIPSGETLVITEGYGIELSATVTYDFGARTNHASIVKFQYSLNNTDWIDIINDFNFSIGWFEAIDLNQPYTSDKDISAVSSLTIRQFFNPSNYNYNKDLFIRLLIEDWFGKQYFFDVMKVKVVYSSRAWFYTGVAIEGEPDTFQTRLTNIPAEKATIGLKITYINTSASTYDFTIDGQVVSIVDLGRPSQLFNEEATEAFFNLLPILDDFDASLLRTQILFKRKVAGLNPIANFTFTPEFVSSVSAVSLYANRFNGSNAIVFEQYHSTGESIKSFYKERTYTYLQTEISTPIFYWNNQGVFEQINYENIGSNIYKIPMMIYGTNFELYCIDPDSNRVSNIVYAYSSYPFIDYDSLSLSTDFKGFNYDYYLDPFEIAFEPNLLLTDFEGFNYAL